MERRRFCISWSATVRAAPRIGLHRDSLRRKIGAEGPIEKIMERFGLKQDGVGGFLLECPYRGSVLDRKSVV